jgi:signal transduction histidine kinase
MQPQLSQIGDSGSYRILLKTSIQVFVPAAIVLAATVTAFHWFDLRAERKLLLAEEQVHVDLGRQEIDEHFTVIASDLRVLAESAVLEDFLTTGAPALEDLLAHEYLVLARNKRIYDQVRLLDETGQEIIRINFNDGNPLVIPEQDLQNKSDRYYFADTLRLNQGDIFISPLDLNIERGEIEKPFKPMIRFGTPVYDAQGRKQGILLLNFLGNHLLERLISTVTSLNNQPMLLNEDGFWLIAPDSEDAWGFMLPHQANFATRYPEVWAIIIKEETGQVITPEGAFTFTTVYPMLKSRGNGDDSSADPRAALQHPESTGYFWKVISFIPETVFRERFFTHLQRGTWQYVVLLLLMLPVSAAVGWFRMWNQVSQQQVEELETLTQLKDDFLSMVSHDLRSPLTNMKMILAVLHEFAANGQETVAPGSFVKYVQLLGDECDRELNLVNDLLDLQRIESGRTKLVREPILLNLWIPHVVSQFAERAAARQQKFTVEVEDNLPSIDTDPNLLHQVVGEMLTNACKYTPPGERIHLAVCHRADDLVLQVTNFNSYIEPEQLPRIFEKFYRVPQGDRWRQGGTGLGLPLAQKLTHHLGGTLTASSTPEQTIFTLKLPLKTQNSKLET